MKTKHADAVAQGEGLPILIGITGHRKICPTHIDRIRETLAEALRVWHSEFGSALRLVSALADGADQLAAEVASSLSIPVIALLPMPRAKYRATLSPVGAKNLDRLLATLDAGCVIELPVVETSDDMPADLGEALQYEQLGIVLCRQCHILVALWDGHDAEPLAERISRKRNVRGGTPHIVSMRLHGEYAEAPLSTFDGSLLFVDRLSRLELTRSGPLLHIMTPRDGSSLSSERNGIAYWYCQSLDDDAKYDDAGIYANRRSFDLTNPEDRAFLKSVIPPTLRTIVEASVALGGIVQNASAAYTSAARHLGFDQAVECQGGTLARLFAAADVHASDAQQNLMGSWSPGLPWPKRKIGQRRLGALFVFGATIPLAAICFEVYCEYGKNVRWLLAYVLIIAASFLFYRLWVRPQRWQTRYQDFRALAEALRVQYYWVACGVPLAVSDNYLRHQEDDIGWIKLALRGPSLLGLGAALKRRLQDGAGDDASLRKHIANYWFEGQYNYFTSKIEDYRKAVQKTGMFAKYSLIGSFGIAVCLLTAQLLSRGAFPKTDPEWLADVPTVAVGVLPALAAFFLLIKEARAYEDHMHSYSQSAAIFAAANHQAEHMERCAIAHPEGAEEHMSEWRELVTLLGKQALTENAVWIQTHRARPVSFRSGG